MVRYDHSKSALTGHTGPNDTLASSAIARHPLRQRGPRRRARGREGAAGPPGRRAAPALLPAGLDELELVVPPHLAVPPEPEAVVRGPVLLDAGRQDPSMSQMSTAAKFWSAGRRNFGALGRSELPSLRRRATAPRRSISSRPFSPGTDRWRAGVAAVGWPSGGSSRRSSRGCGRGG